MAAKKGAPGYNNLVPETSAYFKDKPKPKKPERERQFAYELKVHIKDKADCDAFAKCIQHPLSRKEKAFTYSTRVSYPASQWKFVEDKPPKPKKISKKEKDQQRYKNWFYNRHWVDMPSFRNEKIPPYISFTVRFNTKKAFMDFALKTGQTISVETKSIWYPERQNDDLASTFWISSLKNKNPRYPLYIVSKGRAGTRLTSRTLEKMKVPYFIAVEPQEYDQYAVFIDPKKILPLPFSNHGDGPGPARNWCMANAKERGFQRCWLLDDNIDGFYRLHENKRIRVGDGAIFRAAEDFVDRYENVPVAGFQYRFFIAPNQEYPPFVKNTRIYSCLLVDNDCKHEWRGRYNEDTILSLDVLSDGDCTIQFNSFLQGKAATQTLKGGNTDEFYSPEGQEERAEGTRAKSEMLQAIYPDLVEVVYRYGRWHHHVDYSPFRRNRLKPKIDLTKLPKTNDYGMLLKSLQVDKQPPKATASEKKIVASSDDALFYSTISFTTWNSGNLLPCIKILETQSSRLHWLTNLTRTASSFRSITEKAKIELAGTLCIAPQVFEQAKKGRYEDWSEVYHDLDPRPLKSFKSLFIMGGVLSTGSQLHRHKKRAGVFPYDRGQLTIRAAAIHLINLLLMLKAHHEFKIPIHDYAFDPLELSLSLFHETVAPTSGYYNYHGYPIAAYNMHRLDCIQYYFANTQSPEHTEKTHDFVFGFTMLKGSGRHDKLDYMHGVANSFPKSKVQLFVRDDANGIDTKVAKQEYLSWLARSRYTFVLPAYDRSQFSITRLLEALHLDCLPIIHPDVCMKEVEKSFGVKLGTLTTLPASEKQRLELLHSMKRKFLPFRKSFVKP